MTSSIGYLPILAVNSQQKQYRITVAPSGAVRLSLPNLYQRVPDPIKFCLTIALSLTLLTRLRNTVFQRPYMVLESSFYTCFSLFSVYSYQAYLRGQNVRKTTEDERPYMVFQTCLLSILIVCIAEHIWLCGTPMSMTRMGSWFTWRYRIIRRNKGANNKSVQRRSI